eukprot:scaffold237_cov117-Isochrysis_galbana.AAC.3
MRGLIIILSEFAFAYAKFNFVQRFFPPHTPTLASDGQRAAADGRRPSGGGGLRRRALEAWSIRRRSTRVRRGRRRRSPWLRLSLQEHGGGGLWRLPGCLDLLGRLRRHQSSPLVFGTGRPRWGRPIATDHRIRPRLLAGCRRQALSGAWAERHLWPVSSLSLRVPAMRAAVVPVPGRAAIARTAASGAAPPLPFASEGDPTTHGASCGAAA